MNGNIHHNFSDYMLSMKDINKGLIYVKEIYLSDSLKPFRDDKSLLNQFAEGYLASRLIV